MLGVFAGFLLPTVLAGCSIIAAPESQVIDQPRSSASASGPTYQRDLRVHLVFATLDASTGTVSASGYVQGAIEDGGSCVYVFTTGERAISSKTAGTADASTTSCGTVTLPSDGIVAGTTSVTLSYEYNGHRFSSDVATVSGQ